MDNQINQYQQRLFYKLFTTLPVTKKDNVIVKFSNFDIDVNNVYFFINKDYWFAKYETEDKFLFFFGIKVKHMDDILVCDACLMIDFDKNIQFNNSCLGLFSIKTSEIHILINLDLLNERYPNINIGDFKIINFKSFVNSQDLNVFDLGNLDIDFIDNLEKLIKAAYSVKSQNETLSLNVKKDSDDCKICSKKKSNFKIDSNLTNLSNLRPELCGKCIEKIVASEFYTKASHLLQGNRVDEIKVSKEKFGNDHLFDIGLKLLEKYGIIQYVGVKKLFYTIDKSSYLVKKYLKYSNKNDLLIDHIRKIEDAEPKSKSLIKELTKSQTDSLIDAVSNGKSIEEAAKLADIPPYKLLCWYNDEGQGYEPEDIYFFRHLKEIENKNEKLGLESKMKQTLEELKVGNNINQIDFITEVEFNEWINKGKQNKSPYNDFYHEYEIFVENEEYEHKEINRKIFLENFKSGKTKEESAENADVEVSLIDKWYFKGSQNEKPFVEFYNKYLEAENNKKPQIPKVVKTDAFGNKSTIAKMNGILEDMANGKSEDEAILNAKVSRDNYDYWINRGKQEFGDVYIQFYKYINELKSKQSEIFSDEELNNEILVDEGIFEPLLEEYESSFNSMNKSGIAWVNKTGSKWTYSREINGKTIRLSEHTLQELYKKVIEHNLIWGIRDYDRAKNYLDFPEGFEIPNIEMEDEEDNIDRGIYAPLPVEYESSFSSMNQSGIAWVNLIGKKFYYVKSVHGKSIRLVGESIYELYEKVKNANQIWGIRDYERAKKYIDIPEDFEIPEKQENDEEIESVLNGKIDKDIYAPLSLEHLSKFNPNPKNRTGIAWVNKIGNNWIYQRQRNGKMVKFSDPNIIKLYEKVIANNQIWGIFDINKASKVIETNSIQDEDDSAPQKLIKPINPIKPIISMGDVTVNYIEKSKNQFDILIRGVIKNNDLINVLTRLDSFKEDIKRIITNSSNNESDIFIELGINKYSIPSFEAKIEDLGWKIIK